MKLCTLQDPNMKMCTQSSHIMILNSTKFGGNRTKDLEVGPERQTGRFLYTPQTTFAGGIIMCPSGTTCLPADNYMYIHCVFIIQLFNQLYGQ
jgi:hypothetical protein